MATSKWKLAATIAVLAAPFFAVAQEKTPEVQTTPAPESSEVSSRSALIIREFAVGQSVGWPYDPKQLQSETVAQLRSKCGAKVDVLVGPPATNRIHSYTLDGEIVSWRPGSRAKRMLVGMGSGREAADIHYWLTDETGKRVFDHKDTIRAEFLASNTVFQRSAGELAYPFASKIAARLTEAKVF